MLWRSSRWVVLGTVLSAGVDVFAQERTGSVRGVVYDQDFETPLAAVDVSIVGGEKVETADEGNFLLKQVPPGKYTLVFAKEGYVRQVKTDVVVSSGRLTDVNVWLTGSFKEMEEFVVQDILQIGAGTEAALLQLRFESAALMDSISADLMSRAGASDAAAALRLVAGTTVKDDKSAVIRGLPDRYVSSQLNGVRLPTADEDKRAVELDQFPAAVIESIQVTKTFTPDQQGDASGGAVNVITKGIPDETVFQFKIQSGFNTQVAEAGDDFLSYKGGGVSFWGNDHGSRDIQYDNLGGNWNGAVGTSTTDMPIDYKWSGAFGGKHELDDGTKIGGFVSFFYENDNSYVDGAIDDSYWVTSPGAPMTPRTTQGTPLPNGGGDYKTRLFDVTQGGTQVQWGGLATVGIETEHDTITFMTLYTQTTEDKATLAIDTRGKDYFFPGHDPDDPTTPGHGEEFAFAAPYQRLETLEYTERSTGTFQLSGRHNLPVEEFGPFQAPELDWLIASNSATLDQPDKRQFGAFWVPGMQQGPLFIPATWHPLKPADNANLGNLQRTWKEIEEDSNTLALNAKFPFEQWSGDLGYLKLGLFYDTVDRSFDQESFSNFNDFSTWEGGWNQPWSAVFPFQNHPIEESLFDVDYDGEQDISAAYGMIDLPLSSSLNLIGGIRFESTEISIVNDPEERALWYPPGSNTPTQLNPGDGDVDFDQVDALPSIGMIYEALEGLAFRASYAHTVARPTFKELSPIIQQSFLGGPIFIGNPDLGMSKVVNYDLRLDYTHESGLMSVSWFHKNIEDPIEYVQRVATSFDYTTAVNYPKGELTGWELEIRQGMGDLWEALDGLSLGANATFLDSEVTLSKEEQQMFNHPNIQAPTKTRDMTNAPEYLYNIYATYDVEATATQFALFYTVQGDTLLAGAGTSNNNFVPDVYSTEYGTLNFSIAQRIGEFFKLQFQAKNLTDPDIETVYRSKYIDDDVTKSSYKKGIDFTIAFGAEIPL